MKNLTCEVIAILTGARCIGRIPTDELSSITTDSRNIVPGSLFGAICGERVDGHNYLASAKENGAVCALVEHPVNFDLPQLLVESTEKALQVIAAYYRNQFSVPVIGVTGSVGKTTAKEMIFSVLSQHFCTMKTEKNFNNELGVPFTLFTLNQSHEAAVVEMGISDFGEMTRLTNMVKPDIAVFTLIGDAHLEFLKSREGVLKAKSEIINGMKPEGCVIANGDDALLKKADFGRKTILFGLGENCDLRATDLQENGVNGTHCKFLWQGRALPVFIPSYGRHMVYAALMGAAVGFSLGLSDSEIIAGIKKFENVGHRDRIIRCKRFTVIDDCYNSNPSSASEAVQSMLSIPGRHVCILGDMLELGDNSPNLHKELGALAAQNGCIVIGCGELAKHVAAGAGENARWYENTQSLINDVADIIQDDDVILVKASRRMKFEDITEKLITVGE